MTTLRILILGGYGTFGGRLARLLVDEPRVTLIIAGRDLAKSERFCCELAGEAEREPARFDRDADLVPQIAALSPDIVVDASGPFQSYGDDPYRVLRACIACGCHYMDLADGSAFVEGVSQFDEAARAKSIFLLSGVSSFPVLTCAAVRELSRGMAQVDAIRGGIAPSPYAGVGENVIRAISSYAGKGVALVRDGRPAEGCGLIDSMRYTIAPPGYVPLNNVRFSLVDVPDLRVLPTLWPELRSIWMGAGPVPAILHRMLSGMSWLVRLGLLRSLVPFAPLFHRAINVVRWGEHRGGMFVEVSGRIDDDARTTRSWHLLAEGDQGPLIPSMAVEGIVRLMLDGRAPQPGARAATTELDLADYQILFSRRSIIAGFRGETPATAPLYQRVLGAAWSNLPPEIRVMHEVGDTPLTAEGAANVVRGKGRAAAIAAVLFGFPKAGRDVPLRVTFEPISGGEIWRRKFGTRALKSVQTAGNGRDLHLIRESFGPVTVSLAVVVDRGRLKLVVRRWHLLGIPMPLALAPHGDASEFVEGGRFRFDVEIRHAFTGPIVRYEGWLAPVR